MLMLLCSCGKQRPVSSAMSSTDAKALAKAFARLDEVLASRAPKIFANLGGPAGNADITELRKALNGAKIDALEAWYRWHNGTLGQPANLLPVGYPISIKEALKDRKMIGKVPFVDGLRKGSIKILEDGAGDGFFLDITKSRPTVFYHMLEEPTPTSFGSMRVFVGFITECFEDGTIFVNDAGKLDYHSADYNKAEERFLARLLDQ